VGAAVVVAGAFGAAVGRGPGFAVGAGCPDAVDAEASGAGSGESTAVGMTGGAIGGSTTALGGGGAAGVSAALIAAGAFPWRSITLVPPMAAAIASAIAT
jgi:hypothetical protein